MSTSLFLRARTQLRPTSTLSAPRRLNPPRISPRGSIRSRLGLRDPRITISRRRSMCLMVRLISWYAPLVHTGTCEVYILIIIHNVNDLIGRGYRNHPSLSSRRLCFLPRRIQGQGSSLPSSSIFLSIRISLTTHAVSDQADTALIFFLVLDQVPRSRVLRRDSTRSSSPP